MSCGELEETQLNALAHLPSMPKISSQLQCNLCRSSNARLLFRSDKYPDGRSGDIYKCKECGLVFRFPVYLKERGDPCEGRSGWRPDAPANFSERRARLFEELSEEIVTYRKYNRILDVGSGHGFFLKLCKNKGWEVWGVEPDPDLVKFSRDKLGIDVSNARFEEVHYSEDFFDVVTLINVLEHMPDPHFVLKKVWEILRPGGLILMRFPNAAFHVSIRRFSYRIFSVWQGVRGVDLSSIYLFAFDKATCCGYLQRTGFNPIGIRGDRSRTVTGDSKPTLQLTTRLLISAMGKVLKRLFPRNLLTSSLIAKGVKLHEVKAR